ncbi:MAG: PhoX family protein [Acidimicrobiales bacterium]
MTVLDDCSNPSSNPHLVEVAGVTRRAVLGGGLATMATALFGAGPLTRLLGPTPVGAASPLLGFVPIGPSTADEVVVPPGYETQVLIPWGAPINGRGPKYRSDATNSAADQAKQIGTSHDGMWFFPLPERGNKTTRGLLAVNHEFADQETGLPADDQAMTLENVRKLQNAQGVSVVELALQGDRWVQVPGRYNRRITSSTPMEVTGPAAGHELLRTPSDPTGRRVLGTANNCASGYTPWGTYLTCEENFNAYFGTTTPAFVRSPLEARYGFGANGFGPNWFEADRRFDLRVEQNEANRFGWVVEIDPFDPRSTPKKRTALGRVKHENAEFAEAADGRAVIYTGDDERNEYLYKYVSARPWRTMVAEGVSPLDEGTLHVAIFGDDATAGDGVGVGTWAPLTMDVPAIAAEFGGDLGAMLVNTRRAADLVGATKMDRPEWVAVSPVVPGRAAVTLTNNSARSAAAVDEANPRPGNPFGHIVVWDEAAGDHGAVSFDWRILLLAGDPANEAAAGGPVSDDIDAFGAPDGLWWSPEGRLWIQTDGTQPIVCNNQMLCCDPATGEVRRFLVGPKGCEITGVTVTPDGETMFVNVQHPGEGLAQTPATPAAVSDWPDRQGRPRAATVMVRKVGGGVIGS